MTNATVNITPAKPEPIKILVWADTPTGDTGFSTVCRNILENLYKSGNYAIDIIGINQYETFYDQKTYPYKIIGNLPMFSEGGDVYGKDVLFKRLMTNKYNYIFSINNISTTLSFAKSYVKYLDRLGEEAMTIWVAYVPVESDYIMQAQLLGIDDIPCIVTYTQEGAQLILEARPELADKDQFKMVRVPKVNTIPHGTNTKDFYPYSIEEKVALKKELFGLDEQTMLVTNINRFQWRKDIFSTILAFAIAKRNFSKMGFVAPAPFRDMKLYLHCDLEDVGGNLPLQIESAKTIVKKHLDFDFDTTDIIVAPKSGVMVSREVLNKIYNASDLVVSSSFSEGWGLSITEAMATKTSVLVPTHTSFTTIIGEFKGPILPPHTHNAMPYHNAHIFSTGLGERGFYYEVDTDLDNYVMNYGNINMALPKIQPRELADSIICALLEIANARKQGIELKEVEAAYKWVQENTWEKINESWLNIFK